MGWFVDFSCENLHNAAIVTETNSLSVYDNSSHMIDIMYRIVYSITLFS